MSQVAEKYYSVEEYFALEEKADRKSEYYNGKIYLMSGGSANHSRISVNSIIELSLGLRGSDCEVFNGDMRVLVEAEELYTYPDAAVVCGEAEFALGRNDTLTNPVMLVEVLSPSNEKAEMDFKRELYLRAGAQEYWVCDEIGTLQFFNASGPINQSVLCPAFPKQLEA